MKLRLVKTDKILLLYCPDGSIMEVSEEVLVKFLKHFNAPSSFQGKDGFWKFVAQNMESAPGQTLAYVDDDKKLIILNAKVFRSVFISTDPKYISVSEYAEKHNKGCAIVKRYCLEGRIKGAYKSSMGWVIPEDAPYPKRLAKGTSSTTGPVHI